jgi:hypothetical protein
MQTQKMSLANIKGKLNRAEMKNIMAGSGGAYCIPEYGYGCGPQNICCFWLRCERNGTNSGTLCMP